MAQVAASLDTLVPFKRGVGRTTPERSRLMGRVRQTKTAPEEAVAAWLRTHQIRYRRNVRTLPGRPDFANKQAGFAIFVHGCFWHRHPGCPRATTPTSNRTFWMDKFAANIARDAARGAELKQAGFRTITVWECETKTSAGLDDKLKPLLEPRPPISSTGDRAVLDADPNRNWPSDCGNSVRPARRSWAIVGARIEGAGS